jgi:N-acetylglucosamine kinase-like BadF-type ATPase
VTALVAGIDVGGTKTRTVVETSAGEVLVDVTEATTGWRGASFADKGARTAAALLERVAPLGGPRVLAAVGVGAHGCDLVEESEELQRHLAGHLPGVRCVVVNDAELVAPAADRPTAVGLIAGTGSVAVGRTPSGDRVHAGGWGWLVGDEGGASGIVREAVRASLRAVEDGSGDPLPALLCGALGVDHVLDLPGQLLSGDPASWSAHAGLVFDAQAAGSALAARLVDDAGAALADLVARVVSRGALGTELVAAGGVIAAQPSLRAALDRGLAERGVPARVQLLQAPPVAGAVRLARAALLL